MISTMISTRRRLIIFGLAMIAILFACPFLPLSLWDGPAQAVAPMIFWEIRVPRVLGAFLAGAGLATCGLVFQSMFRNVLATPFTLGVSSGAAFGASLFYALGFNWSLVGLSGSALFAILGALGTTYLVFLLGRLRRSANSAEVTLLLSGVVISFFFSSLILLLQYLSDFAGLFKITRWLMGSLELMEYRVVVALLIVVVFGAVISFLNAHELNLLSAGEEFALSKGVAVVRVRWTLVAVTSLVVGAVVSFCGPIGFVGIMVPHICRILFGLNHRVLSPCVFLFGGAFLVLCDTLARTAIAPYEIPVGVITSLLGGPFFLWLLLRGEEEQS